MSKVGDDVSKSHQWMSYKPKSNIGTMILNKNHSEYLNIPGPLSERIL